MFFFEAIMFFLKPSWFFLKPSWFFFEAVILRAAKNLCISDHHNPGAG